MSFSSTISSSTFIIYVSIAAIAPGVHCSQCCLPTL
jgi:hypothetical protein